MADFSEHDDTLNQTLEQFGLAVPIWDRPVTREEIQYFLDRWPYLQIMSVQTVQPLPEAECILSKQSNWTIINYGDAMCSSPGEFLFASGDDDRDGGGGANPGKGTIWRQAYLTVSDMVILAKSMGWEKIHVVDGHPLMKWAVWMHTLDEAMSVSGFNPSDQDRARRERVKRSQLDDEKLFIRHRVQLQR